MRGIRPFSKRGATFHETLSQSEDVPAHESNFFVSTNRRIYNVAKHVGHPAKSEPKSHKHSVTHSGGHLPFHSVKLVQKFRGTWYEKVSCKVSADKEAFSEKINPFLWKSLPFNFLNGPQTPPSGPLLTEITIEVRRLYGR